MKQRSRMFHLDQSKRIRTWNVIIGCLHACYIGGCHAEHRKGCWARQIARRVSGKTGCSSCRYFIPHLHEERLKPLRPRKPTIVFVAAMSDFFADFIPDEWKKRVLEVMEDSSPNVTWFMESREPDKMKKWLNRIPPSTILSTTIEGTDDLDWDGKTRLSRAPTPYERYMAFRDLDWPRKHVSIEPVLGFELDRFVGWMKDIEPEYVSVGYDNWHLCLPEPLLEHTKALIRELRKFTFVEVKTLREAWWMTKRFSTPRF